MRGLADSTELLADNARLKADIASRDASPFLGQRTLERRIEFALHAEFIRHGDGPVAALDDLLGAYPAVAVAFMAGLARTKTGQDGHNAFYRHLEEALGADETTHDMRRRLWLAFRRACMRLGLPIPTVGELLTVGKDRFRLEYFVQAGPLNCDLPSLAEAFLSVHEQLGDYDDHDPTSCRNALDAARIELGDGAKTLQRVLANDRAAWHASAFARLARGEAPRTEFELDFSKAIQAARLGRRAHGHGRRPTAPRLVFAEGGLALRSPATAGWTWTVAGPWTSEVIVGPDQDLPLGRAQSLRWKAASIESGREATASGFLDMAVWGSARLLVFDAASGALLARAGADACEVAAETVDLVSKEAFRLEGAQDEQSEETLEGLHHARLCSQAGPVVVATSYGPVALTLLARPTLSWGGGSLTLLQGRPVFGAPGVTLVLQLPAEEREAWAGRIEAVIAVGKRGGQVRHRLAFAEVNGDLTASLEGIDIRTFERLEGHVSFIGEERALLQAPSAWFWPGLQKVDDGRFCGPVPANFAANASRNVARGLDGLVAGTGAGRLAELAFSSGDGLWRLSVRTGDIQIELVDRGVARIMAPGSTILDDGSPKQLRIWCADRSAALDLCGVVEREPFRGAGYRSVSLAGLASRRGSRKIELWPGGDHIRSYNLALLTRPAEPESVRVELIGGAPRGEISLGGNGVLCGSARRLGGWEALHVGGGDGLILQPRSSAVGFRLSPQHFADGLWLIDLCERHGDEDAARPMRTARGDRHALLCASLDGQLEKPAVVAEELQRRDGDVTQLFLDINAALMTPWSRESWDDGGLNTLDSLWWSLGRSLVEGPSGRYVLARAMGAAPPPDANPSWVPLRHPYDLFEDLYSGDLDVLASVLADADSADVREFSHWLVQAAEGSSADFPRRREACLRFVDRMAAACAGTHDMPTNEARTANASRLIHAVPMDHESRRADEAELGDISDRFAIMARVPSFFSTFARCARQGGMRGFLAGLDRHAPGARRDLGYVLRLGPELLALSLHDAENRSRNAA